MKCLLLKNAVLSPKSRKNKKKKIFILMVITAFYAALILYYDYANDRRRWIRERYEVELLSEVLICYANHNNGCLPSQWDDLVSAGLAQPSLEGYSITIYEKEFGSPVGAVSRRGQIEDIKKYKVAFGSFPQNIKWIKAKAVHPNGLQMNLIISPSDETQIGLDTYLSRSEKIKYFMELAGRGVVEEEEADSPPKRNKASGLGMTGK